jgi:hypothetical protein
MKKFKLTLLGMALMVLATSLIFTSCSKEDDGPPNGGNAKLAVRLSDGPADYDAIYLDIQQVEIISETNTSVTFTPLRPGIYDILRLRNGLDTLLLNTDIQAGTISQIRLLLGPNNSIVVDGSTYALNTPSAQESGLKLNLHETLEAGKSYEIMLDFDAAKSIVQTGNGQYKLKPVIRAYTAATAGRMEGYVLPLASLTTVYAINGVDTFSAIPNANGYFQITGLPAGNYSVLYDASGFTYHDKTVNNISVSFGVSTDLGIVTLLP